MAEERASDRIHEGMTVRSADGEKLGRVTQLFGSVFEIEKGFFFPKEYTVPYSDVVAVQGNEIFLSRPQSEFITKGIPPGVSLSAQPSHEKRVRKSEEPVEEARLTLAEEEVTAQKHAEEAGRVIVRKEVVTEQKQITVPITTEVVRVEHIPATNQELAMGGEVFQEKTVTIPVREEVVDISKRPVVREEVRVTKSSRETEKTVETTVRKERADIATAGDLRESPAENELPSGEEESPPPPPKAAGGGSRS